MKVTPDMHHAGGPVLCHLKDKPATPKPTIKLNPLAVVAVRQILRFNADATIETADGTITIKAAN